MGFIRRMERFALAGWIERRPPLKRSAVLRRYARSRILRALYFMGKDGYWYEQEAFLNGVATYLEAEVPYGSGPVYKLRRNIHRLEKGLCMRPRRGAFARGYIEETVSALESVVASRLRAGTPVIEESTEWALDVLFKYFEDVDHDDVIKSCFRRYQALLDRIEYEPGHHYPHVRSSHQEVSYEALLKLALDRRSVRTFVEKPVSRDLLDRAVAVAMLSPSACNRIPYEFRIYDAPEIIQALADLAPGMVGWKENVPCLVAVVGQYRAYYQERDRHLVYVDASLAAMAFELALVTQGLASCSVNWPQIRSIDAAAAKLLNLASDEKVVMLIAVGHADPLGLVPSSAKQSLATVRSYNRR